MNRTAEQTRTSRPLTKRDLDEQIGQVAAECFAGELDPQDRAPVPISAADFVRRMHCHMVYN